MKTSLQRTWLALTLMMLATLAQASPFAKPGEAAGIIVMNTPKQADFIYPVRLVRIDDQEVPVRDNGVWLKPGTHRLRFVTGSVDANMAGGLLTRQRFLSATPVKGKELVITVEPGKKYYVGYDVSDRNPKNWQAVVWQVK